jgi:TolB-like protein
MQVGEERVAPYFGDRPFFFVSYSHEDLDVVQAEIVWIDGAGFNLWYDEGIGVGTPWREALAKALLASVGTIYFCTANSISSQNCLRELNFTLDQEKPVFVVQLDDTPLSAGLRLSLADRQVLIKSEHSKEGYQQKLLSALRGTLEPNTPSSQVDLPSAPPEQKTDPPSIAIHWFQHIGSEDHEARSLTDGISGDLISKLSQRIWQVVSAQPSDGQQDPVEVGKARRVRYLLGGHLQRRDDVVRLTVRLTSALTGREVWAQRYERSGSDLFRIQDELVNSIEHNLFEAVVVAENERLREVPDSRLDAWGLCARSGVRSRMPLTGRDRRKRSRQLLELALKKDPEYAYAHCIYAWLVCSLVINQISDDPRTDSQNALDHANKALELAPNNMIILSNAAVVHRILGDATHALHLAQRGAELGGRVVSEVVSSLLALGRFEEAVKSGEEDPEVAPIQTMALANLVVEHFEEAVRWARIGTSRQPFNVQYWVVLSAALAASGRVDEAKHSFSKALEIAPRFSLEGYESGVLASWGGQQEIVDAVMGPLKSIGVEVPR